MSCEWSGSRCNELVWNLIQRLVRGKEVSRWNFRLPCSDSGNYLLISVCHCGASDTALLAGRLTPLAGGVDCLPT
jgi:hypothetical protein